VYEEQLRQVEASILATAPTSDEELVNLKNDLKQLIDLSKQNLLELKKQQLLDEIEQVEKDQSANAPSTSKPKIQDERSVEASTDGHETPEVAISSLVGNKCLAPFKDITGQKSFHNAIIFSAEQDEESGQVNVVVVFSHPTQLSMVPCKFYMEGSCKFSTDRCKYSHGQSVDFLDLGEFRSPDYSQIKSNVEGTKILALDPEAEGHQRLWKHASLVQYENEQKVHVIFGSSSSAAVTLSLDQVLPLSGADSGDQEEDEVDFDDDTEFAPVQLALTREAGTSALGDWESGTRGIGSKLMSKMGYIHGTGLGSKSQGLVEPVPVVVYPSGKSLDWCMNAKSACGRENDPKGVIYLDKKRKTQASIDKAKVKAAAEASTSDPSQNVFDIINNKLGGSSKVAPGKSVSGLDLSKGLLRKPKAGSSGSDQTEDKRKLNMENFKTMEKIQKTQREIDKVEGSLARCRDKRDRALLDQKLARLKSVRDELKSHERNVESSLSQRSKRKLEIF